LRHGRQRVDFKVPFCGKLNSFAGKKTSCHELEEEGKDGVMLRWMKEERIAEDKI